MTQEEAEKKDIPTKGNGKSVNDSIEEDSRSIKGELFDWATNNLFFAILPLFVAYLALPISGDPATVLERGDAFILTAALLAPEIAALRNVKVSLAASSVKSLLNVMFLLVILSTVLFITSTSNYNATHPDIVIGNATANAATPAAGNNSRSSLPFPTLTSSTVVILSVVMLIVTILIVYLGIRERRRLGGAS